MAGCAKKSCSKSTKTASAKDGDKVIHLHLEMPSDLFGMIEEFAEKDGIAAEEELGLMIQIGIQARADGIVDLDIVDDEEEKAPAKKAPSKAPAKKAAPAKAAASKTVAKEADKKAPAAAAKKPAAKEANKKAPAKKADSKAPAKKVAKK